MTGRASPLRRLATGALAAAIAAVFIIAAAPAAQAQKASPLRVIAENFERLSAQQVARLVVAMPRSERLQLSIYQSFGSLVHLRACQAAPQLVVTLGGAPTNCLQTRKSWVNTLRLMRGNWAAATQYAARQRQQILIGMRCSTGEYSRRACQTYGKYRRKNVRRSYETGQTILRGQPCAYNGQILADGRVCRLY